VVNSDIRIRIRAYPIRIHPYPSRSSGLESRNEEKESKKRKEKERRQTIWDLSDADTWSCASLGHKPPRDRDAVCPPRVLFFPSGRTLPLAWSLVTPLCYDLFPPSVQKKREECLKKGKNRKTPTGTRIGWVTLNLMICVI
jgi:hypothetical protein